MKVRAGLAILTAIVLARPGLAAVDVQVSGQSVDVRATSAPLSEVLDRLARQTNMKVVYDGAPPRQTISLDLHGRTLAETVIATLEGQGVNYALAMDPTGTRVETLLISGTAASSPAGGRTNAVAERPAYREPPPEPIIDEPEAVAEDEGQPPPDTTAGLNLPGQQTKEAQDSEAAAPPDAGLGGFSASPFAPTAARVPQPPQPTATPPPFNP